MTTVFSITALAQGGNDPIEGIDIIMKEDPSLAPIKPFSMTGDEMAQLNRIKGVGRMELILKAASKRVKADEGFIKSGMSVMGKDWCGECPWPEKASHQFKSGKTTYKLDLKFHAENRSKYIGETGKNLAAPVKAQSPDGTASQPEQLKNGGGGNMMNILTFQKYNDSVALKTVSPSGESPDAGNATQRSMDVKPLQLMGNEAPAKATIPNSTGCAMVDGAVDANCDGVDDAKQAATNFERERSKPPKPRQQRR